MSPPAAKEPVPAGSPTDPNGPTGQLSTWIHNVKLADIPDDIVMRAKYLLLDGLACLLVGAHLPWSEAATKAIFAMEGQGTSTVCGWDKKISPFILRASSTAVLRAT